MQYGLIGWSVSATLGYAQAMPEKRVIACIGDGSFQVPQNCQDRQNRFFLYYNWDVAELDTQL